MMEEKNKLEIISAQPLTETQKKEAIKKGGEFFEDIGAHEFTVDPGIIGGVVFKTREKILDLSVVSKINQIKKHLEE